MEGAGKVGILLSESDTHTAEGAEEVAELSVGSNKSDERLEEEKQGMVEESEEMMPDLLDLVLDLPDVPDLPVDSKDSTKDETNNLPQLWAVRHGERMDETLEWVDFVLDVPHSRRFDPPLTDAGRLQALQRGIQIAEDLIGLQKIHGDSFRMPYTVFASPLDRALNTAVEIAAVLGISVTVVPGLGCCASDVEDMGGITLDRSTGEMILVEKRMGIHRFMTRRDICKKYSCLQSDDPSDIKAESDFESEFESSEESDKGLKSKTSGSLMRESERKAQSIEFDWEYIGESYHSCIRRLFDQSQNDSDICITVSHREGLRSLVNRVYQPILDRIPSFFRIPYCACFKYRLQRRPLRKSSDGGSHKHKPFKLVISRNGESELTDEPSHYFHYLSGRFD